MPNKVRLGLVDGRVVVLDRPTLEGDSALVGLDRDRAPVRVTLDRVTRLEVVRGSALGVVWVVGVLGAAALVVFLTQVVPKLG